MNVSNSLKVIAFFSMLMILLLGCASEAGQFSPEEVINNALKEKGSVESYYAEAEWTTLESGEKTEQTLSKEWRSEDGKVRVEMQNEDGSGVNVSVTDGNVFMLYMEENKEAFMSEDPELQELNQSSPKDQALASLELISDTHELSSEGEEEILGRTAYHLKATAKEEGQLLGDQEIWIDKENWLVLKTVLQSGDDAIEMVYTMLDFDVNILEDTFTLDLPDDVHIQTLEDMDDSKEVTLNEAVEELGSHFYYFPEQDDIEIDSIELSELDWVEINRMEIDITYTKDSLPLFSVGIFESEDELGEEDMLPGDELVTIRDQDGFYTDMDGFRMVVWQEDGLNYSLLFVDPGFSLEDLQQLAETMEVTQ